MKYIKDFNKFDINQLKRFIVSLDNNIYFIDQMIGASGNTVMLKNYSTYYIGIKEFEKYENTMNIEINIKYLDNVVYSASNYDDCYNYLKMIIDSDKYNI